MQFLIFIIFKSTGSARAVGLSSSLAHMHIKSDPQGCHCGGNIAVSGIADRDGSAPTVSPFMHRSRIPDLSSSVNRNVVPVYRIGRLGPPYVCRLLCYGLLFPIYPRQLRSKYMGWFFGS